MAYKFLGEGFTDLPIGIRRTVMGFSEINSFVYLLSFIAS